MGSLGTAVTSVPHDLPSMQNDPVVSKASELLRLGLMPSAESIKAGQVRSSVMILYPWGSNVATCRTYSI